MSSKLVLEKCCLLSDAAAGDPTQFMIDQAFARLDLDWRFSTFEIQAEQLPTALAGLEVLGFGGVLVAEALRGAAYAACEERTPAAERAASVNSLVRLGDKLVGDNTLASALRQAVGELAGRHAMVLGSGAAARTFAAAVLDAEPHSLVLASSNDEQLAKLAAELSTLPSGELLQSLALTNASCVVPTEVDLLILAVDDQRVPDLDPAQFDARLTLVDPRVSSSRTRLVKLAGERGAKVVDGIELLVNETALAVERWIGTPLDRAVMRDAVEEYLGV